MKKFKPIVLILAILAALFLIISTVLEAKNAADILVSICSEDYRYLVEMYGARWGEAYAYPISFILPSLVQIAGNVFAFFALYYLLRNANDLVWGNPGVKKIALYTIIAGIIKIVTVLIVIFPVSYGCVLSGFTVKETFSDILLSIDYDKLGVCFILILIGSAVLIEWKKQIEFLALAAVEEGMIEENVNPEETEAEDTNAVQEGVKEDEAPTVESVDAE